MSALDHSLDLEEDEAVPVDAVCTGCQRTTVKRPRVDAGSVPASFQDVCHRCHGIEWWNVVAVLEGLYRERQGGGR